MPRLGSGVRIPSPAPNLFMTYMIRAADPKGVCPQNVRVMCSPPVRGNTACFARSGRSRTRSPECPSSHDTPCKNWVRERHTAPERPQDCQRPDKRPAHPSNRLVAQLNANWRVVDDPLQWILQQRKGNQAMPKFVSWYRRDSYPLIWEIMDDKDTFPVDSTSRKLPRVDGRQQSERESS